MATPALDIQSQVVPPQMQKGQEHTTSDPQQGTSDEPQNSGGLSVDDQRKCIGLVRNYKDQWSQNRLFLMQRFTENLEFFKGNQYISFGGGTAQFFDANDWMGLSDHAQDADDDDIFRFCYNFYQMLCVGFVAALCTQVPKSVWMPEDAEQLADTTTAKAAQILIDIVEQQNREQSLLKGQLMYFFSTGSCFRHTRYIVSADRAGTRKEPVFDFSETTILPARNHCYQCGADSSPDVTPGSCPNCGEPLGADSYFPPTTGPVVQQVGTQSVPNGMVAQDLYCGLEVDADPAAMNLRQTPILNLEVEVHVAALRAAYPDMYSQIQASATSELSANGSIDRIARQQVFSQATGGGQTNILTDQKPTLSRSWIQPWAFDLDPDPDFGKRMRTDFPSGMLLITTGEVFLNATEADLNEEWTWAGTHEKYGLYPPAPGDVVLPFQKDYNDLKNILKEGIDRGFAGITLGNADLIGTKSLEGKRMLPGIINPIKPKKTGAPGSFKLQDALWQFTTDLHIQEAMQYLREEMMSAQNFAMVPPQVMGGPNDPATETFGGQKQQLNTALGVLNIYWENLREEHAQADEQAVNCAKDNLTDDLKRVLRDKGSEFTNEYVRLDDLQGSVRAYPDVDQGLPVTAPELRQRWMDLMQSAKDNPVIGPVFDDPSNQEQAARALGVPGMVVPGEDQRSKTLQILEQLLKAEPIPQTNPQTGQPTGVLLPTIMPDKDIDDFVTLKETVKHYLRKHYDLMQKMPAGFQNCLAYLTQAVAMETAFNVQQAQNQGTVQGTLQGAGAKAAAPPPKPPPQLTPAQQQVLTLARQDGAQGMADLVEIAGSSPLGQGQSLQAQGVAAAKLVDVALKAEQLNSDITGPQGQ